MLAELLYAEGVPTWWYVLLRLELVPFAAMLAWTLLASDGKDGPRESVALNGTVLLACAAMLLTTLWGAVLVARAGPAGGVMRWAAAFGLHFIGWAFVGSAMVFAAFHALAGDAGAGSRRLAALAATTLALVVHAVSLWLTWVGWPRP